MKFTLKIRKPPKGQLDRENKRVGGGGKLVISLSSRGHSKGRSHRVGGKRTICTERKGKRESSFLGFEHISDTARPVWEETSKVEERKSKKHNPWVVGKTHILIGQIKQLEENSIPLSIEKRWVRGRQKRMGKKWGTTARQRRTRKEKSEK